MHICDVCAHMEPPAIRESTHSLRLSLEKYNHNVNEQCLPKTWLSLCDGCEAKMVKELNEVYLRYLTGGGE